MSALHHVWLAPDDSRWALLAQTLASGDTAVMLGAAADDLPGCTLKIQALGVHGVRWCTPAGMLAAGVCDFETIDDAYWWTLIAAHPDLLEWN